MSHISTRPEQSSDEANDLLASLEALPVSGATEFLKKTGATTIANGTVPAGYTNEEAQDAVGGSVGNGLDYDDGSGSISVDESELNHNSLANLTTGDPHTQYGLLAGRAGGQTFEEKVSFLPSTNYATTLLTEITTSASPTAIAVDGNFIYTVGINKLEIFYRKDDGTYITLGTTSSNINNPDALVVAGDIIYVINAGSKKLCSYNVSNKSSIVFLTSVDISSNYSSAPIAIRGRVVYVPIYGGQAMQIFDISDPSNLRMMREVATGFAFPYKIAIQGDRLFLSEEGSGGKIEIYDITISASPVLLGTISSGSVSDMAVSGIFLHTVGSAQRHNIYNISNPASVTLVSNDFFPYVLQSISVAGRYCLIGTTGSNKRLIARDLADTATPVDLSTITVAENVNNIINSGGVFYTQRQATAALSAYTIYGSTEMGSALVHSFESGNLNVRQDTTMGGNATVRGTIINGAGIISLGMGSFLELLIGGRRIMEADQVAIDYATGDALSDRMTGELLIYKTA